MKLKALLEGCNYDLVKGDLDVNIEYITEMQDEVREKSLFILYRENEGEAELKKALSRGASAVIAQKEVEIDGDFTFVKVDDARIAMAKISQKYFNNPSFNFRLIGITGSTEKTPTIKLIANILKKLNKKVGTIGTEENYLDGKVLEDKNVAQNTIKLQHLFHEMALENVSDVVMEVSSRTIAGDRVHGINYDIAVFTNLEYDQAEKDTFYDGIDDYKNHKREIFIKSAKAAVNMDDENYEYMIDGIDFRTLITYSIKNESAVLYAYDVERTSEKTSFFVRYLDEDYKVDVLGDEYSVHTILAAMSVCLLANISMAGILKVLGA